MSTGRSSASYERRLGYALKRAQHAVRGAMDDALRSLGITTPQYAVLAAVERQSGLTNADLARAAFVTAQSMQGILANLERDGLIERQATPENRRLLACALTASGRALVARAHAAVDPVEQSFIASFGKGEADRIADLLIACADRLDAVRVNGAPS